MSVALYLRVSTEEQRERQSIITQQDFGLRYCALHQLQVVRTYADDGVSGTVPFESRPTGRQLLLDAEQRKFDQLLVFKLDRIGRETRLILNAVAQLEQYGVGVRSLTEQFDTATATGRLMLTLLSGFAAHERESIRERSLAGSHRLAEAGTWLGGVVPYGYRKQGERSAARLVIQRDPMAGLPLTEAEVIETIYRQMAVERQSCQKIADYLNERGIPCASQRNSDDLHPDNNSTGPVWRPALVRSLILNRTYMGQHLFGKRSRVANRAVIVRPVPAIIPEALWEQANQVLRSKRSAPAHAEAEPVLLRGLIRCGCCGLLYSAKRKPHSSVDYYYCCNGRQFRHKLYGKTGPKCSSPTLHGPTIEQLVWADIESFLKEPELILEQLSQQLVDVECSRTERMARRDSWLRELEEKSIERDRVLALFRRGRIEESTLDRQLNEIESESATLRDSIDSLSRTLAAPEPAEQIQKAEEYLASLCQQASTSCLGKLTLQRQLIEALVDIIYVELREAGDKRSRRVVVRYRFNAASENGALILEKQHPADRRHGLPIQLRTLGDHVRHQRLTRGLTQQEVAERIGASRVSLHNWERNRQQPALKFVTAIHSFLGYAPKLSSNGSADQLRQGRTSQGLTRRQAAMQMGVHPSTLARWERNERQPRGKFVQLAQHLLKTSD